MKIQEEDTNEHIEGNYCIRSRRLGDRNKIDPTEKALKDAVKWNQQAYGFPSIYKPELLK